MNEVMQNIVTRRSVRKFTDQHISAKELEQIVEAAVYAPSAMNRQSWHFTVIRSREKIQKLAAAIGGVLGNAAYNCYEPDTMILVAADRDNANGQLDTGCAMENIFLQRTLSGSVPCGSIRPGGSATSWQCAACWRNMACQILMWCGAWRRWATRRRRRLISLAVLEL